MSPLYVLPTTASVILATPVPSSNGVSSHPLISNVARTSPIDDLHGIPRSLYPDPPCSPASAARGPLIAHERGPDPAHMNRIRPTARSTEPTGCACPPPPPGRIHKHHGCAQASRPDLPGWP